MTSIEKLDAALSVLANTSGHLIHFKKSIVEITRELPDLAEAEIVVNHLIVDGYAERVDRMRCDDPIDWLSDRIYKITFKGRMFNENGGYAKKEKRESNLAILQSCQTWAIVVGTLAAGIYGLFEIWGALSK